MSSEKLNQDFNEFTQITPLEKPRKLSTTGKILLGLTGGVAVGLSVLCAPFLSPALRKFCLPYIPATPNQIRNILEAIQGRNGKILDIGSGDGRIVLEMARNNFEAHGVELNPWLVLYSRLDAFRQDLGGKTKFFRSDLWKFSLKGYDNVIIFGVEQMMSELEAKFNRELNENSLIIACRFPLPNKKPTKIIGHGVDTVWVYKMKS